MIKKRDFVASMQKKQLFLLFCCLATAFAVCFATPVFAAECGGAPTAFIECNNNEGGIWHILNLVVDILTIGIGIVGLIGILVIGVKVLTSKDNANEHKKARIRLFEIVVGLAIYAVAFALVKWLMPQGTDEMQAQLEHVGSTEQIEEINEMQENAMENSSNVTTNSPTKPSGSGGSGNSNSNGSGGGSGKANNYANEDISCAERIARIAEDLSWPLGTSSKKWKHNYPYSGNKFKKWSDMPGARPTDAFIDAYDTVRPKHSFGSVAQFGADCGVFITTVLQFSGHDKKKGWYEGNSYFAASKKWEEIKNTKGKRGDVCSKVWSGGQHWRIYLGDGLSAEAGHTSKRFAQIVKANCSGYTVWRVKE